MYGFVVDNALQKTIQSRHRNYWDVYWLEINEQLGLRGRSLSLADLKSPSALATLTSLVIGFESGQQLCDAARETIRQWVAQGGILIGCGVQRLDDVFGVTSADPIAQPIDNYTLAAYCDIRPHRLTHTIHPIEFAEHKWLIFSDVRPAKPTTAIELAHLYDTHHADLGTSAVCWNRFGEGFAAYIAFDLAKTVWVLHEGKPLAGPSEAMPYPRAADKSVLAHHSRKVPYADELCLLVQNLIAQTTQLFIHPIPPSNDGTLPDAMLYWGGDEYEGPVEYSLKSSNWMRQKGLGYHINIMTSHPMTPEQMEHIRTHNRHEIGQYYGLHHEDKFAMKPHYYTELTDAFAAKFGFRPITTVNKWLRWEKMSEPAQWMLDAGVKSDNSFFGINVPFTHPMANGPFWGFGFGTAFPFFFRDTADNGNRRIDFLEQPIICYEIGHRGSMAIADRDQTTLAIDDFHLPITLAVRYHFVMNMFYHPVYIAEYPQCRKAIEGLLEYIDQIGATVAHVGNDAVWKWWTDRSASTLTDVVETADSLTFTASTPHDTGMAVRVPITREPVTITCSDVLAQTKLADEFGIRWLYIIVPTGTHAVKITFQNNT